MEELHCRLREEMDMVFDNKRVVSLVGSSKLLKRKKRDFYV